MICLPCHKEYDGQLNFATDAWMSPNSRAFVAMMVYPEHGSVPILLFLDIVEVAESHSGANLATAFTKILEDYEISHKICTVKIQQIYCKKVDWLTRSLG